MPMERRIDKETAVKPQNDPEAISEQDIIESLEEISGYIDITPEDFREIYTHAYRHSSERLRKANVPERHVEATPSGYFAKMKGTTTSPARVSLQEVLWSWIGAFFGIGAVAALNFLVLDRSGYLMIIGSFGASAVLIYGAIKSPLAQPRNFVGGHVVSAIVGVSVYLLFRDQLWLAAAVGVATAIVAMHFTRTLHPPGGATALIAIIGNESIHRLGYLYVVIPVFTGAVIMLAVALLVNNIPNGRRYPEFWL